MPRKRLPLVLCFLLLASLTAPARADLCMQTITDAVRCGETCVEELKNCATSFANCATETYNCGTETIEQCTKETLSNAACEVKCAAYWIVGKSCSCESWKSCTKAIECTRPVQNCPGTKTCQRMTKCSPKKCDVFKGDVLKGDHCKIDNYIDIIRYAEPGGSATCRPASDMLMGRGCCGSPGNHGCVVDSAIQTVAGQCKLRKDGRYDCPSGCVGPAKNKLTDDLVCNIPVPTCGPGVQTALDDGGTDVTFYTTSDMHHFRPSFNLDDLARHVAEMNSLPGTVRWDRFFSVASMSHDLIGGPRGVLINGDFTLDGTAIELGSFRLLYEKDWTQQSLRFPVFIGLGNHDIDVGFVGQSEAAQLLQYQKQYMSCQGVRRDPKSGAYAWKFGKVHFIQFNNFLESPTSYGYWDSESKPPTSHFGKVVKATGVDAAKRCLAVPLPRAECLRKCGGGGFTSKSCSCTKYENCDDIQPNQSTIAAFNSERKSWLTKFLADELGSSSDPLVVLQHSEMSTKDLAYSILANYNVIGIFYGHSHQGSVDGVGLFDGYNTSTGGSAGDQDACEVYMDQSSGQPVPTARVRAKAASFPKRGEGSFTAARVNGDYMDVGHVYWNGHHAGVTARIAPSERIPSGDSTGCSVMNYPQYYGDPTANGCHKRINASYVPVPVSISSIEDTTSTSRTIYLKSDPKAGTLSGPLALKFRGLCQQQGLINRSFVDGCAIRSANNNCSKAAEATTEASSPYMLLNDGQLARLNKGWSVKIVAQFSDSPTLVGKDQKDILSVVQLVPWTAPPPR